MLSILPQIKAAGRPEAHLKIGVGKRDFSKSTGTISLLYQPGTMGSCCQEGVGG